MQKTYITMNMSVKCFFSSILLSLSSMSAISQNPQLVVRIDDMGVFHAANEVFIDVCNNGIATSIEVMPVAPWFPEAVKLLEKNPQIDIGIHLAITSEWENMKWRPLTNCPSLVDPNGYFFPMMGPNPSYPGQSVLENTWKLSEVEKEFRAQIELGLKNIPQASHISGHMGSLTFDDAVYTMVEKLAEEYHLTFVYGDKLKKKYNVASVGYLGSNSTAEKQNSFINMLESLEKGKNYIFLDHPMYNTNEVATIGHIGYEWVAEDRQGVTNLLKSEVVKDKIQSLGVKLINYNNLTKALPRSTPASENVSTKNIANFYAGINKKDIDLHSFMLLRNGKVVTEKWFGEHNSQTPHNMYSVSKTFTAMAIGFAIAEKRITVNDKVISFFPDYLPEVVSPNLSELKIKDLLTMSVGHDVSKLDRNARQDWRKMFLSLTIDAQPGTEFNYNSLATYMLSAIIQQVYGQKMTDYLYPRLFRPLGIAGVEWVSSPEGIDTGGWGLSITTEDMAKLGQFILQKGNWQGKQLIPASWIEEMTSVQIDSLPADTKKEDVKQKENEWMQGYGYQMWRCRHNAIRADGAYGQFIMIMPDKQAVVVMTANSSDMQAQMNLVWKHILPGLK